MGCGGLTSPRRSPEPVTSLLERYTPEQLHALVDKAETDEDRANLSAVLDAERFDWNQIARPKQQAPEGDWVYWALVTGRGFGKTRTGAEWLRARALETRGDYAIIAPTIAKARDVCVESGIREDWKRRSGLLSVCAAHEIVYYNRSIFEIGLINGSKIKLLSAEEPGDSEGWNFTAAWCDEFSSWKRPEAWFRTLLPAVRVAGNHRFVITTTPKRNELTRWLLKRGIDDPQRVRVVRGSTMENIANLGDDIVEELRRSMSARLARQELEGELLDDVEGALWTFGLLDGCVVEDFPDLSRLVIGVDPAVTAGEDSDDTGIVAVGRAGRHGVAYVIEDATCHLDPTAAMGTVVALYHDLGADEVIVEVNNGGDYLPALIRTIDPTVKVRTVRASRGKLTRAEPIHGLYEHGQVQHVGRFADLEEQMTSWVPGEASPDRLDALVWAVTALFPELEAGERVLRFRGAA